MSDMQGSKGSARLFEKAQLHVLEIIEGKDYKFLVKGLLLKIADKLVPIFSSNNHKTFDKDTKFDSEIYIEIYSNLRTLSN